MAFCLEATIDASCISIRHLHIIRRQWHKVRFFDAQGFTQHIKTVKASLYDIPQHVCCTEVDVFQIVREDKRIDHLIHQSCAEWHASVQTRLAPSLTSCRKRKPFLSDCKSKSNLKVKPCYSASVWITVDLVLYKIYIMVSSGTLV